MCIGMYDRLFCMHLVSFVCIAEYSTTPHALCSSSLLSCTCIEIFCISTLYDFQHLIFSAISLEMLAAGHIEVSDNKLLYILSATGEVRLNNSIAILV